MHYLGQLPDLPLPHTGQKLRTRRKPLAQIVLCQGCCCGQVERGLPAVPLDFLKPIWRGEKLNKIVQLTVSGCLGPCDLPDVCCIVTPDEQAWYGRLTTQEDYAVLLDWARRCRDAGELQPLPAELAHLRFQRWPLRGEDEESFEPIEQDPADMVLLSAADTDILTWSAARARLPEGFASVRALQLDRLGNPMVFGAYLDDVLQEARVILVRALGGLGYWREQVEQIHLLARTHGIALVCLPGDAQPDPELVRACTVPPALVDKAFRYCAEGGVANAANLLRFLSDALLKTQHGFEAPATLPATGIYDAGTNRLSIDASRDRQAKSEKRKAKLPGRPTVALAFYRSHWVTGNLAPIDALVLSLERRGLNVLAAFGPNLSEILGALGDPHASQPLGVDALIATTSFAIASAAEQSLLERLDVPVFQAIFCSTSENVWSANIAGLSPRDLAMNVALPEFDGRIITTAVSFKNTQTFDAELQTEIVGYLPRPDRVEHVADLAARWVELRETPNEKKRVAVLLANYPSKNARVGNAVGLDTPASLHGLLLALRQAGYDLGSWLPADGQELIQRLIEASTHDPEFAAQDAFARSPGRVSEAAYRRWLEGCPKTVRAELRKRWGEPDQSPIFDRDGFPIAGLLLGHVFIGIQPARGYDDDPSAVYHSPDLEPPHAYLAFYRWLRNEFQAQAVIHLGKHGNLEWLPGKSCALSEACYPEVMLQDLPNIYPFIINNPGEGTQAKRRSAAVIVDHLIPPMTHADTYGELRQLEHLLDEYYAVQGLDPAKEPLIRERIGKVVEAAQLHRDLEMEQAADFGALLGRLDGYLCELKEAQIRDGLHVLGSLPDRPQLVDLILSLVQLDNGPVPGLPRALAAEGSRRGAEDAEKSHELKESSLCPLRLCESSSASRLRTECRALIEAWLDGRPTERLSNSPVRHYVADQLLPRLRQCSDEIGNILRGLEGRFVPPGPSGAPTRGRADVLPTGRNFYSLDIRAIPTQTAWQVGCAAANALLQRHRERTGSYPESIAMVVWGTSNMRTQGDDIAEVLYLLGVKPLWEPASRRVVGLEAIPLGELNRPRIDVTVRISGLFRDAFPNLVKLLNDAVALVARLDEPLAMNYLKAHLARDMALLCRTLTEPEARRRAAPRVFGSKPGAYGAGLLPAIDHHNWESAEDLARIYLTWSSYAYTGGESDGEGAREALELRLSQTQVVAQNQDNREHDIFDSDDYFQFHGGLIAAVRSLTGNAPHAYLGDTSRPDAVRARTLQEEAYRVFRSRVVNPKWLAGVMRHGYKGAVEMTATVDYLFGYDATANVIDDWMYEKLARTYLLDEKVRDFLQKSNPWAERAMIERLLEAAQRGLWDNPNPELLQQLRGRYLGNEAWLEGLPV